MSANVIIPHPTPFLKKKCHFHSFLKLIWPWQFYCAGILRRVGFRYATDLVSQRPTLVEQLDLETVKFDLGFYVSYHIVSLTYGYCP